MSTNRYKQDAGFVNVKKLPTGPNGRALCRRCQTEVPKGRKTFCSEDCVHEWRLRTSASYLRSVTFNRDKGICAMCGLDCVALEDQWRKLTHEAGRGFFCSRTIVLRDPEKWPNLTAFVQQYPWHNPNISNWAADHIVPVVEGGGECGLENIRTLCLGCHNQETKKLRERLKQKRRDEKRALLTVEQT